MTETHIDSSSSWILKKAKIDFPVLRTKRLILDRLEEKDLEAVFQYASDPATVEWVSWPAHQNLRDTFLALQSIENCLTLSPPQVFLTWAIRPKDDRARVLGAIHFSQFSEIAGQIDFVLGREHWNRGIVTEATGHLITWLFLRYPKLRRLQCHCVSHHAASRSVMEKCGMNFEGIRREGIQMKNRVHDLAIYAIVRSEAFTQ